MLALKATVAKRKVSKSIVEKMEGVKGRDCSRVIITTISTVMTRKKQCSI